MLDGRHDRFRDSGKTYPTLAANTCYLMTGPQGPTVEQTAKEGRAAALFNKPFNDEKFLPAIRRSLASEVM
jgi:hypothetical protein